MDDGMWVVERVLLDSQPKEFWDHQFKSMYRQLAEQLVERLERGKPFVIAVRLDGVPNAREDFPFHESSKYRLSADVREVRTMECAIPVPRYVETDFRKPSLWQRAKNWFKAEMQECGANRRPVAASDGIGNWYLYSATYTTTAHISTNWKWQCLAIQ
jgi:hypothetical protein